MNPLSIIGKKRDGQALGELEIRDFAHGCADATIPDYQIAAWLMAVTINGMSDEEVVYLTRAMLETGTILTWGDDAGRIADKHSTGGMGDKTSLIIAPLLAESGMLIPMISGRGLGATGGTLDKLEAIPGFRTSLPMDELQSISRSVGCVIGGATSQIAPADRKLYALRDVTETVASIPLITASILSKKLAEGLDFLVLDVKCGNGAFMKHRESARQLAKSLVRVSTMMGVQTTALITDMNQPLGLTIGNAIEVNEVLEVLAGDGPDDVRDLSVRLTAETLAMYDQTRSIESHEDALRGLIDSGRAMSRFQSMVKHQGGALSASLTVASATTVTSPRAGYVQAIDTQRLGELVVEMGGGRSSVDDAIDPGVGLRLHVKTGFPVEDHGPLVDIHASPEYSSRSDVVDRVQTAFRIEPQPCDADPLILETMVEHGG